MFIVFKAIAYWLDRYGLVYSNRGNTTGASYADVNAALPAKTILFWIAIIIAILVIVSLWLQERATARHRVHRAAHPEHRHQRHLPGDRPADHGQAEREPEGSALHQPQYHGDPSGLRHQLDDAPAGTVDYENYNVTSDAVDSRRW